MTFFLYPLAPASISLICALTSFFTSAAGRGLAGGEADGAFRCDVGLELALVRLDNGAQAAVQSAVVLPRAEIDERPPLVLEGRDPVADRLSSIGHRRLDRLANLLKRGPLLFGERCEVAVYVFRCRAHDGALSSSRWTAMFLLLLVLMLVTWGRRRAQRCPS